MLRDFIVYVEGNGCGVHRYRDKTGLKVTAIVQRRSDGAWIAVEVKLGGADAVDAAAESLKSVAAVVDPSFVGSPKTLVVITATGLWL